MTNPTLTYFGITSLINGVFALGAAIYLIIYKRKTPVCLNFAGFALATGLWATFYAIWLFQSDEAAALFSIRLAMCASNFIPFLFLIYVCTLSEIKLPKPITLGLYIIPCLLAAVSFTPWMIHKVEPRMFFPYWPLPGIIMHCYVFMFSVIIAIALTLLFIEYLRAQSIRRWQIKWVLVASAIGFLGGMTNWFLWYDIEIPPIWNFLVVITFLGHIYLISRRQLFDADTLGEAIRESRLSVLGTLAASMNHEIKNPLYIAKESLQAYLIDMEEGRYAELTKEEADKRLRDLMQNTINQIARASSVVKRFSGLYKQEKLNTKNEQALFSEALESVSSFFSHEFKTEGFKIIKTGDHATTLSMERGQLEEILLNLIVNARHATGEGGTLTIDVKVIADATHIQLTDNGPGIAKSILKSIWEPFFSRNTAEGTGLGLYIVKTLVNKNGGKISINSEVGVGTTFTLEFPRA